MPIQITTTKALIGINTTRGKQTISQPKGEQTIKTTAPKLKIRREAPRVIIDQYQCFAEAGLKNYIDLTKEYADLGHQYAMEGIARRVEDGNRMAMIQKNMPDAIPELAEKNAWDPQAEFNMGTIPRSRPKIDVEGSLDIDWEMGNVDIQYTPQKPIIDFNPGKVEVYLRQKPSIEMNYVDARV